MVVEVEFGTMDDANTVREEYADALVAADDRRTKSVRFDENDLTDREVDEVTAIAEAGRAERQAVGQVALTAHERRQIDFSKGRANVPHARSVKAIMTAEGVDDWIARYDPTLTVDEHREVAERAGREGGGQRLDEPRGGPRGDAERYLAGECDHAKDVCQHGDPEACEFLGEACDFSEEEIDRIMGVGDDPDPVAIADTDFTGAQLGALRRAWGGYYGAVRELDAALDTISEAERNATDAFAVINAIRADAGQAPIEPRRLEEIREVELSEVCETGERAPGQIVQAGSG